MIFLLCRYPRRRQALRLRCRGGLPSGRPRPAGGEADQLEQAQRGALRPHRDALPGLPKRGAQL